MNTLTVKCRSCRSDRALRPFNVRWLDEDRGWRSLDVVAASEDEARGSIEELIVGYPLEVRPIGAALHAI